MKVPLCVDSFLGGDCGDMRTHTHIIKLRQLEISSGHLIWTRSLFGSFLAIESFLFSVSLFQLLLRATRGDFDDLFDINECINK